MDLTTKIGSLSLPNPVGTASGTFGFGEEYAQLIDLNKLGAIYTKAITMEPREGNALPRLAETSSGLLNSIGLANVGIKRFETEKLPYLKTLSCPVILNVGGKTEDEYAEVVTRISEQEGVDGFEINISCPNVSHGGLAFGTDPKQVERLTSRLRKITTLPLILKLTPNVTDIALIAAAAENGGADAVSCINTVKGMAVDINSKSPVIPAVTAGLSGPAIKPIGLAAVWNVSRRVNIPVIGLGGITSAEDAIEYLLAGASAIQIGTALFMDSQTPIKVLKGIRDYMIKESFSNISDFHGYF